MNTQRLKIKEAIQALIEAQNHRAFQRIAIYLAKRKWPELQATEEQSDGGEDATSFEASADGRRRRVAVSLTGTLAKIKLDAGRIRERGVKLDSLVFITPVAINNVTVGEWAEEIRKEFGHELHVIEQAEIVTLLEEPENRWLCRDYLGLDFTIELPIARLVAAVRIAAAQVLNGWKAAHRFDDAKAIELTLLIPQGRGSGKMPEEVRRLIVEDLCRMALERRRAALSGGPGAGKTFTLIQLADALLQRLDGPIPILIPLPIWATSGESLLEFIESQFHGNEAKGEDLAKLFALGHVMLLLNGWNEVPDSSVERVASELNALALHYPGLSVFISTRNSRTSLPLVADVDIYVAPLSREQKVAMVKKSGHQSPETFERELESNNALATITSTPLFLSAAIAISISGEKLLQTRYGLLAQVIEHFEKSSEHSGALRNPPCSSFHRRYLEAIALKTTQDGGTTLSFDDATSVIAQCSVALRAEGHFEKAPNSAEVLDCLVRHHLLVLPPLSPGSYRFIHQQFQEWFAAEALRRIIAALGGNPDPEKVFAFQRDFLNRSQWQEPLAFLIERLATGGEAEISTAANLIRWAMPVNLSLAAELAGVAGEKVWEKVRDELGRTLRAWFEKSGKDCRGPALSAMLATGGSDFQDIIWPLIESSSQNTRLFTYRLWRPFPLSLLGPNWKERFMKWDAKQKVEFLHEFSWGPRREHVSLAEEMLKGGEPPEVKLACFEVLLNFGAYNLIVTLSQNAEVKEWPKGFVEHILFSLPRGFVAPLLTKGKAALPSIESISARHAIIATLKRDGDADWPALMKQEVQSLLSNEELDFRALNEHPHRFGSEPKPNAGPYLADFLSAIAEKDPEWVSAFVAETMTKGRLWSDPFVHYLSKMNAGEAERVTEAALQKQLDPGLTRSRCAALAPVGSFIFAKALLTNFLAYEANEGKKPNRVPLDRGDALRNALQALPINCLVDAVIDVAKENRDVGSVRSIVKLISQLPLMEASGDRKIALRAFALQVDKETPANADGREWIRAELAKILGRVAQSGDAEIIEKWLLEDVKRMKEEAERQQAALQKWMAEGRKGPHPSRVLPLVLWNYYQSALVQLGGKEAADAFIRLLETPALLGYAAGGLYSLSRDSDGKRDSGFGDRPDYAGVWQRQHSTASQTETVKNYADEIFSAIQRYLPEFETKGSGLPKHDLLGAVSVLAALNDPRAIPLLTRFASEKYSSGMVMNGFHTLMLQGTVLSGDEMASFLDRFIEEQEKEHRGSNNDTWYLVVQAIAILLFSDKPALGIERIRKLPEYRLKNYYVRDLLGLLGASQTPEAIDLMMELALKPEINEHYLYEVATVLSKSRNPAAEGALITLLDKFCAGELNSHDAHSHLPKAFAQVATGEGRIWQEIKRRCANGGSSHSRQILLSILSEAEGLDTSGCLCDLIDHEFPLGYAAEHLIQESVTKKVSAGGTSYYIKPRSAADFKKRLINIAYSDANRKASAARLLDIIGRVRAEYGWPANEPFHPDIELAKRLDGPWELLLF